MVIQPNSTIALYSGVEISEGEQLVFSSKAKQTEYFDSKRALVVNDCANNKKTGRLRVPGSFLIISTCNYMSFINPSLDNKVIFGRIIDYFYINNECAEITYQIDFWQTWCFDVTFRSSYIEREALSKALYDLSLVNPYDPSILEFRTTENLPVGKDLEKSYYTFGTDNVNYDGLYAAETLCAALGITNNSGALFVFSDIDLEGIDQAQAQATLPLATLLQHLRNLQGYQSSFYILSPAVNKYLYQQYPTTFLDDTGVWAGSNWNNATLGQLTPGTSNVRPPVSYIYIEGAVDYGNTPTGVMTPQSILSDFLMFFTQKKCLDNILGIYNLPVGMAMFSGSVSQSPIHVTQHTNKALQVESKKLCCYPFSYLRAVSPSGDIKELRYEDFKDVQTGGNDCNLGLCLDITERPFLIAAPLKYKDIGAAPHNPTVDMNVREGLVLNQFVTLPYSISAFELQIAALSNNIIGNNTTDYSYEIQQKQLDNYRQAASATAEGVGTIISALKGDVASTVQGIVNTSFSATQAELTANRNRNEFQMSEDAYKAMAGDRSPDNAVIKSLSYGRPAYVSNQYHQINGDGVINTNVNSFLDIIYEKVSMLPAIYQAYDEYFKRYGYKSGQVHIPRVINFMHGSNVDAELPHWSTIDGKECTYIKTADMRIDHAMLPVSQTIKSMFDSGILFIKGDLT